MLQELFQFFGRAICHQLEERTLLVSGDFLSVCARDTGIYIGIFSSLFYLHMLKRKKQITIPTIKMSLFLLLLMGPLVIDGIGSYSHLFESTNERRLITGISFGLALPYFLYPLALGKALKKDALPVITNGWDVLIPVIFSCIIGSIIYMGRVPHVLVDGFIILMIIIWFSLCASFLFSQFRLQWLLAVTAGLAFLSILSILHGMIIS
ncbi:DUF2085 domain-containing protein [Neobacillus mesonae]|uniref:DUF2085 domain-containing protein n=1 Tax=Neobacillus mesonae TaxID=1193713 RepID=UPI00203B941A|nr:DUF2085 domain-containing protein [Neobacillus mesonae]MCM3567472.1 DUF2085 domain-containing protein [Neobacillus mesonae]